MSEFGFWQRWGMELDDRQFANAFTALGVLAASSDGELYVDVASPPSENGIMAALRSLIHRPVNSWMYPRPNQRVKVGPHVAQLASLDAQAVARGWERVCDDISLFPRFRVVGHPTSEPIRPWFRLLIEAVPDNKTVHIEFDAPQGYLYFKWPLRLGYLAGNTAEEGVRRARFYWPSNELTSAVRIDRENANCDVLLFTGSSSQLLRALLEIPGTQKTNLFIVRGTFEDDLAAMSQRLSTIAVEGRASGFVFLGPTATDEVLGHAVNRFVENLSHNEPVEMAVSEAFTKSYPTDPVIFLSRDLAAFQLEHILEKIHRRLKNLPEAARPKIKSDSFLRMGIPVDGMKDNLTDPQSAAKKLKEYRHAVQFGAESSGAFGMAMMSRAIDHEEIRVIDERQQRRFLQRQIFRRKEGRFVEEHRAFLKGVPTLIRVRIGPPDEEWPAIDTAFPEDQFPEDRDEWRLSVVLTEPNHLKEALRGFIKLPRSGPSTACEFRVQPGEHAIFEGRITVVHRGRVLQTAVLKGRVVAHEHEISCTDAISFVEILRVRAHMGDLEGRRQFDLAFVMNHTADRVPRLTAIAATHAWLADLSACGKIVRQINTELSKVAESEKDYRGGLGTQENVDLLRKLARLGHELYGAIVLDQLMDAANQPGLASNQYIQIVSTKHDALMPLEFIYTATPPSGRATLCPRMKDVVQDTNANARMSKARALVKETCQEVDKGKIECPYRTEKHVCPMGFWGLSKVIERHMVTPALKPLGYDYFLQSEQTASRPELDLSGTAIIAASKKVTRRMLLPVLKVCDERLGSPHREAKDWDHWVELVRTHTPHILLALPHTEGNGEDTTLEIRGKTLASGDVTAGHVHKENEQTYPLVALLGCDTAGTALDYGAHINWFRRYEAALVVSTIAKVFGGHASVVAEQLIRGLTQENGRPERVGEIIREIKRQALMDGPLMALCVVAFGDADWKLKRRKN